MPRLREEGKVRHPGPKPARDREVLRRVRGQSFGVIQPAASMDSSFIIQPRKSLHKKACIQRLRQICSLTRHRRAFRLTCTLSRHASISLKKLWARWSCFHRNGATCCSVLYFVASSNHAHMRQRFRRGQQQSCAGRLIRSDVARR